MLEATEGLPSRHISNALGPPCLSTSVNFEHLGCEESIKSDRDPDQGWVATDPGFVAIYAPGRVFFRAVGTGFHRQRNPAHARVALHIVARGRRACRLRAWFYWFEVEECSRI